MDASIPLRMGNKIITGRREWERGGGRKKGGRTRYGKRQERNPDARMNRNK